MKEISSFKSEVLFFLVLFIFSFQVKAQTQHFDQIENNLKFKRVISEKWSSEFDVSNTFSSNPDENNAFQNYIQLYGRIWGNYKISPKWKLSTSLAFYYNKNNPEIGQYKSYEWRLSPQATYYIHKKGYVLSTRMSTDFRYLQDKAGDYNDFYRYRQQLQYLQPLNGAELKENSVYLFTSEEVFFRNTTKETGLHHFERNKFTLGGGYLISKTVQLELSYINEYQPRDNGDKAYNSFTFSLIFSDLLKELSYLY
jgi:hypothetical protein